MVQRKVDDAKRRLLAKLSRSFINSLHSLEELCAVRSFLRDRSDQNYIGFVLAKLGEEKKRLVKAGISEEKWPSSLRGDLVESVYATFNLTPPVGGE